MLIADCSMQARQEGAGEEISPGLATFRGPLNRQCAAQ